MKNFYAFFDNKVIFSTKIQRGNDLPTTLGWDSLFTRYGFIIPHGLRSFNVLDILDEVTPTTSRGNEHVGGLITPEGRVYEFAYNSEGNGISNRIVLGKGMRHARSSDYLTEESITSAMLFNNTPEKALEWFYKTLPTFKDSYIIMSIEDIVKQIQERLK